MDIKHKWINRISVNGNEIHISFSYSDGLGTGSLDMSKNQLKQICKEVFGLPWKKLLSSL